MGAKDIKPGRTYRGKRFRQSIFGTANNDRTVIWIDSLGWELQYDSDTVALGRNYPKVTVEAFARWAKADVSHLYDDNGDLKS